MFIGDDKVPAFSLPCPPTGTQCAVICTLACTLKELSSNSVPTCCVAVQTGMHCNTHYTTPAEIVCCHCNAVFKLFTLVIQ